MDVIQLILFLIQLYIVFKTLFLVLISQLRRVDSRPQLRQLIGELLLPWILAGHLSNLCLCAGNLTIGLGELLLYNTKKAFPLEGCQGNFIQIFQCAAGSVDSEAQQV